MKFFKKLFSPYAGLLLILLLEFIGAMVLLEYFYLEFIYVRLVVVIIEVIFFMVLINKKEAPEFKIPWIIIFNAVPLDGVLMFLLFKDQSLSKHHYRSISESDAASVKLIEDKKNDCAANQSTFNYLKHVNDNHVYENCNLTYFSIGEDYFADLTKKLNEAKEFIFIEYFIIKKGKVFNDIVNVLLKKAQEGVDVRIIYDDFGSEGSLTINKFKLRKAGIKIYGFNYLIPIVSGYYNNRDHRKICVIDHKYAYTGGINIGDEYANIKSPFGKWKDVGVRMEGPVIDSCIRFFLDIYDLCAKTQSDYAKFLSHEYKDITNTGKCCFFGDGPQPVYQEQIGEGMLVEMINNAKKSVIISTPYLIPTNALIVSLRSAAIKGVKVKLLVPGIPDKKVVYNIGRSNFEYLHEAGVEIYQYTPGFNHAKIVYVDDEIAFVGTINLDYRSLVHHFECGLVIYKHEVLNDIKKDLDETFNESSLVTKYKYHGGLIFTLINIFSPLL